MALRKSQRGNPNKESTKSQRAHRDRQDACDIGGRNDCISWYGDGGDGGAYEWPFLLMLWKTKKSLQLRGQRDKSCYDVDCAAISDRLCRIYATLLHVVRYVMVLENLVF